MNSTSIGELLNMTVDKVETMVMADQLTAYNKPLNDFDKTGRIDHSTQYVDG